MGLQTQTHPFGIISIEGMKMSTRKGHALYLEDVFDAAVNRAINIIKEKNPSLPQKETVAEQVGVGAIIYEFLKTVVLKTIASI